MAKTLREQMEKIGDEVAEIHKLLTGGADPSKGVFVRLSLLEQDNARRTRWLWLHRTAILTSLTTLMGALGKWLSK